jgi:hypothetical protein
VDQRPWRAEVRRPLGLRAERPAPPRAPATPTPPETVQLCTRRVRQPGRRGRLPGDVEVVPRERARSSPEAVPQERDRRQALAPDVHDRARARIGCCTGGSPLDDQTGPTRWHQRTVPRPPPWARGDDPPSAALSGPPPGGPTRRSRLGAGPHPPFPAGLTPDGPGLDHARCGRALGGAPGHPTGPPGAAPPELAPAPGGATRAREAHGRLPEGAHQAGR